MKKTQKLLALLASVGIGLSAPMACHKNTKPTDAKTAQPVVPVAPADQPPAADVAKPADQVAPAAATTDASGTPTGANGSDNTYNALIQHRGTDPTTTSTDGAPTTTGTNGDGTAATSKKEENGNGSISADVLGDDASKDQTGKGKAGKAGKGKAGKGKAGKAKKPPADDSAQ